MRPNECIIRQVRSINNVQKKSGCALRGYDYLGTDELAQLLDPWWRSILLRQERDNRVEDPSAALFKSVVETGRVKSPAKHPRQNKKVINKTGNSRGRQQTFTKHKNTVQGQNTDKARKQGTRKSR